MFLVWNNTVKSDSFSEGKYRMFIWHYTFANYIKDSFNKKFIPQKWSGEEKHFDKHTNTLGHNHIQQRSFVQHTQQLV